MNGTSRYGQPEPLNRKRRRSNPRRCGALRSSTPLSRLSRLSALARLRGVVPGLVEALRELLEVLRRSRRRATRRADDAAAARARRAAPPSAEAAELRQQLAERLGVARLGDRPGPR